jgi:hypothetical protein
LQDESLQRTGYWQYLRGDECLAYCSHLATVSDRQNQTLNRMAAIGEQRYVAERCAPSKASRVTGLFSCSNHHCSARPWPGLPLLRQA